MASVICHRCNAELGFTDARILVLTVPTTVYHEDCYKQLVADKEPASG